MHVPFGTIHFNQVLTNSGQFNLVFIYLFRGLPKDFLIHFAYKCVKHSEFHFPYERINSFVT